MLLRYPGNRALAVYGEKACAAFINSRLVAAFLALITYRKRMLRVALGA